MRCGGWWCPWETVIDIDSSSHLLWRSCALISKCHYRSQSLEQKNSRILRSGTTAEHVKLSKKKMNLGALSRLERVLNNVDGSKEVVTKAVESGENRPVSESAKVGKEKENANETHTSLTSQFSGWYSYFDGKACKRYYYNHVTGVTQWEKPDAVDIVVVPPPAPLSRPTDDAPVEKAYFSRTSGRFSHAGSQSYWAMKGREEDKAGRQLGVFMDVSTLEANREEAKRLKQEAQRRSGSRGNVDWSAYKEQKQNEKKRKAHAWLHED